VSAEGDASRAARDLDETRRLLYMAYFADHETASKRHELAGTLTNALVHHSGIRSQADALALGERVVTGTATPEELLALVDEVTEALAAA
jgi:phenylpyruvate tautomerase PptA (4-oxalocrotonate tautomerase family)